MLYLTYGKQLECAAKKADKQQQKLPERIRLKLQLPIKEMKTEDFVIFKRAILLM